MRVVEWLIRQFRSLGPYLALELIMPGGTILALLLWSYRRRPAARQVEAPIANDPRACCAGC